MCFSDRQGNACVARYPSCVLLVLLFIILSQTLPDYVVSTSIIKWDGTQIVFNRKDDPKGFALKIAHFGLLGILSVRLQYTVLVYSIDSVHTVRQCARYMP